MRVYLFCASHTDSSMVREENNTVGTEVVHRQDDWMGFLFHFTVVVVCTREVLMTITDVAARTRVQFEADLR